MSAGRKGLDLLLLAVAILAMWQVLYWLLGDIALASPLTTARRLAVLLTTSRFQDDIWETLHALAVAALLAVLAGVAMGIALGMHRRSGNVAAPMLATLYSLPKVVLYPIVLLIFGLGISARIAFGFIHGVIPITLFAMNAIRNIPPTLFRSALVLRLSPRQTVTSIVLPAALPGIMTGVRVGVSITLLGVLIGEMFAGKRGLGSRLMNAIGNQDIPTILAVALLLSLFALGLNALLMLLTRSLHHRA